MSISITFEQAVQILEVLGYGRAFFSDNAHTMTMPEKDLALDIVRTESGGFLIEPIESEGMEPRADGESDLQYIERMFESSLVQRS